MAAAGGILSGSPAQLPPLAQLGPLIAGRLAGWARLAVPDAPQLRRAAVALTLYEARGTPHLLIIKRAPRYHNPGQWALPGGRLDEGENALAAALRELREETSLNARPDDVLGVLDDFMTSGGYVITPVVVSLPGVQQPRRSPAEVASLHPIPLGRLLHPEVPRWKIEAAGQKLLQMPLRHDMVIHAPTGAILWQFAEVALRGRATRVGDLRQPAFTAR